MGTGIIRIASGDAEASIALSGGCITAYRLDRSGTAFDLLRPFACGVDGKLDPRDASSFPLVPYSNRIANGRFRFAGTTYQLPLNFGDHPHSIHGVGWQMPWRLKHRSDTAVEIELSGGGSDWPFAFHAAQVFRLDGETLRQEIALTNTGEAAMPAGLGMHPYFPRHGGAVLTADVEAVWLNDETCLPVERVACPERWNLREGRRIETLLCDNQFEPWNGRARMSWPDARMSLDLTASSDLDRLVVYAPEGEDFFCVEPVSHMTDAFNRSANGIPRAASGMRVLKPGETWQVWMELSPSVI